MKKAFKSIGITFACLIILLVLAIVLLPTLVNTQAFKQQLIQQVKQHTGQTLSIDGELSFSVFPWLGVKTGKVALSQPKEISDKPFVTIDAVNIGVKLLPLFQKRIETSQMELVSPTIHYVINKQGKNSVDALSPVEVLSDQNNTVSNNKPTPTDTADNKDSHSKTAAVIVISGVTITNGALIYDDQQNQEQHELSKFELKTGNLLGHNYSPIRFSGDIKPHNNSTIAIKLSAQAAINKEKNTFSIKDINASINQEKQSLVAKIESLFFDQNNQKLLGENLQVDITSDTASPRITTPNVDIDLKQYSTSTIAFFIHELKTNIKAQGDILLKNWNTNMTAKGHISSTFNPSMVVKTYGIDYQASDPSVLQKLSFSSAFSGSTNGISLHKAEIKLDDSILRGDLSILNFSQPSYRFDFSLDKINLDRYATKSDNPEEQKASDNAGLAIAAPIPIFKNLNANGVFRAGNLQANGAKLSDIIVNIISKDKKVVISPSAKLYGGTTKGSITYTENKETSTLSIDNQLSNVNFGPLLKDTEITDQVSGRANVDAKITIREKAKKQSNNGSISIVINDGALKGVDIKKILDETQDQYDRLRGKTIDTIECSSSKYYETHFNAMNATLKLNNNVITNDDLNIKAPAFRVSGKGEIQLEPQTLDYLTNITAVNTNSGQGGKNRNELKGITIPVRFYNKLSHIKRKIDMRALIKANTEKIADEKKEELKQKAAEKLGLIEKNEETDNKKDLEDQIKDNAKKKLLEKLFK